jgi:hypothetical protein
MGSAPSRQHCLVVIAGGHVTRRCTSSCQHGQIIPQRGIVAPGDCGLKSLGARASRTENREPRASLGARASPPACGDGGLMEIENLFRYPALAVGLKPSAMQGEARLRGLERIIYSKTTISVAVWEAQW